MNISEFRKEFSVYVVSVEERERTILGEKLGGIGYRCEAFRSADDCFLKVREDPPHMVIAFSDPRDMNVANLLDLVHAISPDTLFFPVLRPAEVSTAQLCIERGAYDVLWVVTHDYFDVISRIDRAAERLCFQFQNEQLVSDLKLHQEPRSQSKGAVELPVEKPKSDEGTEPETNFSYSSEVLTQAFQKLAPVRDMDSLTREFLSLVFETFRQPVVFFRYWPSHQSLVVSHQMGLDAEVTRSVGVNLKEKSLGWIENQFKNPEKFEEMNRLVTQLFQAKQYRLLGIGSFQKPFGMLALLNNEVRGEAYQMADHLCRIYLAYADKIESEKMLFELNPFDLNTQLYNRRRVTELIDEEVRRSRRVNLPVSLITVSIDDYNHYLSEHGEAVAEAAVKRVAQIIKKTGRQIDISGRWSAFEFVLVLPHTPKMGAALRAEKLRRAVESVSFPFGETQPLGKFTVCCGVSEFPSLSSDPDNLYRSAIEALDEVRLSVKNKVCLSRGDNSEDFRMELL